VSARREEAFGRWAEFDPLYIGRWSLWLDNQVTVRAVPAMLPGQ